MPIKPKTTFKFKSKVIVWGVGMQKGDDKGAWRFARVPEKISAQIKEMQKGKLRRGWGAVYAKAKIRKSEWQTSIFPVPKLHGAGIPVMKNDLGNRHSNTYILPLKKEIRYEENLYDGSEINISIEIWF